MHNNYVYALLEDCKINGNGLMPSNLKQTLQFFFKKGRG